MMSINRKTLGAIEQILNSGSSFLFFIIAARTYEIIEFSKFAIIFAGVQFVHTVVSMWICLPIITFAHNISFLILKDSIIKKLLIVYSLVPFFSILYVLLFKELIEFNYWNVFALVFAILVFNTFDIFKFIFVRYGFLSEIIFAQTIKWASIFLFIYAGYTLYFSFFSSIALALLFLFLFANKKFQKKYLEDDLPDKIFFTPPSTKPMLVNAVSNNISMVVFNWAFSIISPAFIGALQAFRSLLNILSLLIQFIEVHVAADMARHGKKLRFSIASFTISIFLCAIVIFSVWLMDDLIVGYIYNGELNEYSWALSYVFSIAVLQALSRIMATSLRLKNFYLPFYYNSFLVLTAAVLVGIVSSHISSIRILLLIMVAIPLLQFFLLSFFDRYKHLS